MLLQLVKSLAARGWHRSAMILLDGALLLKPRDLGLLRERLLLAARAGQHQMLAADCRRMLAVAPNDASALETLAAVELARGNSDAACAVIDDAHRRGLLTDFRFARDALIDPARARSEGVYVATLRDVEIETADWAILDGGKVYNTEAHNRALAKGPHVQGRATPANDAYIFRLPPVSQTIDARCVHLGGDHNFCHWITRNMVKLGLLEGTSYESLPYLINADLRRHQREFLELLNVPEARLIKLERPALVRVRELVVPTNVTNHLKMGIGTEWLRRHLAHCMDAAPPRDLIYVSRSDAKVRRLINEDDVMAALAPLGFERIMPGALPVREQIRRFSRAKVIVGAHGAAFGNLVFAPKTARVIEFTSTFKAHIPDFHVLAKICGFHFSSIVSDDYDFSRLEPYQADIDFRVDVAEVLATLRRDAPELF